MRRIACLSVAFVLAFSLVCGGSGNPFGTTSTSSTTDTSGAAAPASAPASAASAAAGTGLTAGPWKSLGIPVDGATSVTATDTALAVTFGSGSTDDRTDAVVKALTGKGWKKTSDVGSGAMGRVVSMQNGGATISVAATTQGGNVVLALSLTGEIPK